MSAGLPVGFPDDGGVVLLRLARASIAQRLGLPAVEPDLSGEHAWLDEPGASFVTLTLDGRLRGCIGSLTAHRPLGEDVRANALSAAFRDPRFAPLSAGELEQVHLEVSVLSVPEPVPFASEQEALAALRPGLDGAILSAPGHRGTFLPQVWEQLPTPELFWAQLKRKAGLRVDHPADDLHLERYTVTAFEEEGR